MNNLFPVFLILIFGIVVAFTAKNAVPTIYVVGDSTVMDYENYYDDYLERSYPLTGWCLPIGAVLAQ